MENIDAMLDTLREFDELGVQLSIDDFGTGYSSLAYLRHLPIGELKIDRSFVKDLETDPHAAPIVEAILAMAHSLGLSVVAEGVETDAQFAFLAAKGCGYVQGWWLAKSMPAAELERWMAEYDIGAVAERISQARQPRAGRDRKGAVTGKSAALGGRRATADNTSSATTSGRFGERLRPPKDKARLLLVPDVRISATRGKHGRQLLLGIHRRASLAGAARPAHRMQCL